MNCWNCFYMLCDRMLIQSESSLTLFWGGVCVSGSAVSCLNWRPSACCWLWVHGAWYPPSSLVLLVRWAGAALQSCLISCLFFWLPWHPTCFSSPVQLREQHLTLCRDEFPLQRIICFLTAVLHAACQGQCRMWVSQTLLSSVLTGQVWQQRGATAGGWGFPMHRSTCDSHLSLCRLMPCEAARWGCW